MEKNRTADGRWMYKKGFGPADIEKLKAISEATKPSYPWHSSIGLSKFVRVWQGNASLKVIARLTNRSEKGAAQLALRLRKRGVPLKHLRRTRWNNALLRELGRYATYAGQPPHFIIAAQQRRIRDLEQQVALLTKKVRRA